MTRKSYGRTLIEMMSVLAILSILLTLALPDLKNLVDHNQRAQTVNQMVALLHHARSNAVYSRQTVTLCSGKTDCSGEQNWQRQLLLFLDRNDDGKLDSRDNLLHRADVTKGYSWHWNRAKGYIQFEADGSTKALNGTLTLCKDSVPQHLIVISLSGRTRTERPKHSSTC